MIKKTAENDRIRYAAEKRLEFLSYQSYNSQIWIAQIEDLNQDSDLMFLSSINSEK